MLCRVKEIGIDFSMILSVKLMNREQLMCSVLAGACVNPNKKCYLTVEITRLTNTCSLKLLCY